MVRILTATEATVIDEALADAFDGLVDLGEDEESLEYILEARHILKNLKQKTIEEVLS